MKAAFKALVKEATKFRKAIKDETLTASEHKASLDESLAKICALQSELSELETEAADHGFAVADLHAEVDKG